MASESNTTTPSFTPTPDLVLIPDSKLDPRTDDEIISTLLQFQPVTSEKNVWTFWDTGFWGMRPYVRRNIIGWVRRLGPDWTVRVLDHVEDSPISAHAYLDATHFHEAYNNRTMTGPYVGAHSGDVVRLPLIHTYGGVWMDAGTMLFRHIDDICWKAIEDPASPYEIAGIAPSGAPDNHVIMNGFIAAKKGNGFIKRWHDVFLETWKDRTDCFGHQNHPLLRQVPKFEVPEELRIKFGIDNSVTNDYAGHTRAFLRVRMLQVPADGFDGLKYWTDHAFVMGVEEIFLAQMITRRDGHLMYKLLGMQREGVPEEERDPLAERLVRELLANASTMKISHGLKNNRVVHLSKFWDMPENDDADIKPGTYADYLRWGSVHLEQTRTIKPQPINCPEGVIKAGVLEVIE